MSILCNIRFAPRVSVDLFPILKLLMTSDKICQEQGFKLSEANSRKSILQEYNLYWGSILVYLFYS